MKTLSKWIMAIALFSGCADQEPKTGSETHWLSCKTAIDCDEGFVCTAGRCLPEDEAGNGRTMANNDGESENGTTNNGATNNGFANNGFTTGGTNNGAGSECPDPVETPEAVPSSATATFTLQNQSGADLWIPTVGWFCDPWGIDGLWRNTGFYCGCECPNPGGDSVERYRLLPAGTSETITWDGRDLALYEVCLECPPEWGGGPYTETHGVRQPVPAATYQARFPFARSLPEGCVVQSDGEAACGPEPGDFDDTPGEVALVCPSEEEVTASFALPPSGNVDVMVIIQ